MRVNVNGKEMTQSAFVVAMFTKPKKRAKPKRRKGRQKGGRK